MRKVKNLSKANRYHKVKIDIGTLIAFLMMIVVLGLIAFSIAGCFLFKIFKDF